MKADPIVNRELKSFTDDELCKETKQRIAGHWHSLYGIAEALAECIRRAIDVIEVFGEIAANPVWLDDMKKIALGQTYDVLAEKYMGHPVFSHLKRLALDDQRRIAEDPHIEMCVRHGGKFETLRPKVASLTPKQRRLVFDRGRIRSLDEQRTLIESEPLAEEDAFDDAQIALRIVLNMTRKQRRDLQRKADRQRKSLSDYVLDKLGLSD